jgi:hypothetical protein
MSGLNSILTVYPLLLTEEEHDEIEGMGDGISLITKQ